MKKLLYIISVLTLISCTKEFDDDIFSFDADELEALNPEIDPETGEPFVELDPETGEPIEDPELDPDQEEPEEEIVDPELSSDNSLNGWTVLINGQNLANEGGQIGNVIDLTYPFGTDISNVDILLDTPDTATVPQSTTGINFNTNSGVLRFDIVAENGEENPFAINIEVASE